MTEAQEGAHPRHVALTFDDGPDAQYTPVVLDILSAYAVKATFFCIGEQAQWHPAVLRRIDAEGHLVGNHTWNHPYLTRLSRAEVQQQVTAAGAEIERLIGKRPLLFRPPYGDRNQAVSDEIAALGYQMVMWDVDSQDFLGRTGPQIASRILSQVSPGAIILQHCAGIGDRCKASAEALPYVIETLRAMGYRLTTVAEATSTPGHSPRT
jgi:peptidoglycan/xylan/chitin deacetylase (PgdA/CDA1 family)